MIETPVAMDVPIHTDEYGVIRVSRTRVTLETVVARYEQGDSPEAIVRSFDVLKLDDVYAVIAYYLRNREEVEAYIQQVDAEADDIRRKIEALPTSKPLTREMLLARQMQERSGDDYSTPPDMPRYSAVMISAPPRYGRSTFGISMLPSSRW